VLCIFSIEAGGMTGGAACGTTVARRHSEGRKGKIVDEMAAGYAVISSGLEVPFDKKLADN
jgi:hypothetical protein